MAPVSVSAPTVARGSASALPSAEKNSQPQPNNTQAIAAAKASAASSVSEWT